MRVIYFTEKDSPHDRRFLNALSQTGHQVFALRQYTCAPKTPDGITEVTWPADPHDWSDWRVWEAGKTQLKTILADLNPDVVHAGPVQGPAFLAAWAGFSPLVTMSWGSDLLIKAKRSPWMRYATQYTLDQTKILLVDCMTVSLEAARFGYPMDEMVRFPWGVDLAVFSPQNGQSAGLTLRRSLGWEHKFVILCNRTWAPIYGVDVLAKAFVDAVKENHDLRLLLAGEGPLSDLIYRTLAPVKDKVHFIGWLEKNDLPGVYHAADLVVSPSHSDGSSVSLLEAMACGCPVLVSDIPSNCEWVTPGVTGELFQDGDISSLKGMVLRMAGEPALKQYGKQARILAEKRADWEENFKKLLLAYEAARR